MVDSKLKYEERLLECISLQIQEDIDLRKILKNEDA